MTGFCNKKYFMLFCTLLYLVFSAASQNKPGVLQNGHEDQLLLADTAIIYGEKSFKSRINIKKGDRKEAVGLVLSGGSARAFAHLGVLRRLEEASIVPDFIVTNSMGSIVGLLYAAGLSPDQIEQILLNHDLSSLFEPVIPLKGGILDNSRFEDLIRLYVKDLRIEELPIPVIVQCEDLRSKRSVLIMEGDFITVMKASYALPVYFPPVEYKGHFLSDGGISNLLPLGLAMKYSGKVIASSSFYDNKSINLKNPLVILNTSIDITKRRAGVRDILANPEALWIRNDVENYSFMAFDKIAELSRSGYESADKLSAYLSAYSNGGPGKELTEIRKEWSARIETSEKAWQAYSRANAAFSFNLSAKLDTLAWPGDEYYLSDLLLFGAAGILHYGPMDLTLATGSAWDMYESLSFFMTAYFDSAVYLLPWLRFTNFSYFYNKNWHEPWSFYHRTAMESVFSAGFAKIGLKSAIEELYGLSREKLLSSTISFEKPQTRKEKPSFLKNYSIRLGHQSHLDGDNALWANISATSGLYSALELDWSAMARGMTDNSQKAELYFSESILSGVLQNSENTGAFLMLSGMGLMFAPDSYSVSMSELLILRNLRMGAFIESLWNTSYHNSDLNDWMAPVAFAAGIKAYCNLALIGLKSLTLWLDVAWEFNSSRPIARLCFHL